jgi:hypothetical protein
VKKARAMSGLSNIPRSIESCTWVGWVFTPGGWSTSQANTGSTSFQPVARREGWRCATHERLESGAIVGITAGKIAKWRYATGKWRAPPPRPRQTWVGKALPKVCPVFSGAWTRRPGCDCFARHPPLTSERSERAASSCLEQVVAMATSCR